MDKHTQIHKSDYTHIHMIMPDLKAIENMPLQITDNDRNALMSK